MKTFILPCFLIMVLAFGCNNNDDNLPTLSINIQGKWNYVKKETTSSKSNFIFIEDGNCFENGFIRFNNSIYTSEYYTEMDDTCKKAIETNGKYTVQEDKLIIEESSDNNYYKETYKILKMSEEELVISIDEIDLDEDGINDIETFYLKRQ